MAAVLGRRVALRWLWKQPGESCVMVQRRWWFDPDATASAYDKPAFFPGTHKGKLALYIKAQMPVVMLQTVKGVGKKGQIVHVKRGYARHFLVPKGLAMLGTWENIDEFADPVLMEDPTLKSRVIAERGRLPFDWVDEIRMEFVRLARDDDSDLLHDPISVWDVLQLLSDEHELDLLPSNLEWPANGLTHVGNHEIPVRIAFRDQERAAGQYTFQVRVVSEQSLAAQQKQDLAKAVVESRRFTLPTRGTAGNLNLDFDSMDAEAEGGEREEDLNA